MPTKQKLQSIGVFGAMQVETLNRVFNGVLRYVDEVPRFMVSDFRTMDTSDDDDNPPLPCWNGKADGVVVSVGKYLGWTDKRMADWVLSGGVPVVSVASDWKDPRIPCFHTSFQSLGNLAAKHLIGCGCESFLFVGFASATGSAIRALALKRALAKHGFSLTEYATTVRLIGDDEDKTRVLTEVGLLRLLRTLKKPLAIWTLNDNFAAAVCDLCEHLELAVPDEVKILGVDDLLLARNHRPSLSSIRTPGEQIGYLAMQALDGLLQGIPQSRRAIEVPAIECVPRVSTLGDVRAPADILVAVDQIAQHACTGVSVQNLVDELKISRRSFELQFRGFVGHSPGEEIQRLRLAQGRELLAQTQLSVERIASMVGFTETAPFSRFFRKRTGFSPSEYRSRSQSEQFG